MSFCKSPVTSDKLPVTSQVHGKGTPQKFDVSWGHEPDRRRSRSDLGFTMYDLRAPRSADRRACESRRAAIPPSEARKSYIVLLKSLSPGDRPVRIARFMESPLILSNRITDHRACPADHLRRTRRSAMSGAYRGEASVTAPPAWLIFSRLSILPWIGLSHSAWKVPAGSSSTRLAWEPPNRYSAYCLPGSTSA